MDGRAVGALRPRLRPRRVGRARPSGAEQRCARTGDGPQAAPVTHRIQQWPAGCASGPPHSVMARRLRRRPTAFIAGPQAAPVARRIHRWPAGCANGPPHSTKKAGPPHSSRYVASAIFLPLCCFSAKAGFKRVFALTRPVFLRSLVPFFSFSGHRAPDYRINILVVIISSAEEAV